MKLISRDQLVKDNKWIAAARIENKIEAMFWQRSAIVLCLNSEFMKSIREEKNNKAKVKDG